MRAIGPCTDEGGGNLSGGIGVGAETDHHVEQDDGEAGVGQRRVQFVGADSGIDHRVRTPAGEFVGAEIDDAVGAVRRLHERFRAGDGGVGANAAAGAKQNELRFRAQRATRVKTKNTCRASATECARYRET